MINAYNCSVIILRETLYKSSPVYNFSTSNLVTLYLFEDHKEFPRVCSLTNDNYARPTKT